MSDSKSIPVGPTICHAVALETNARAVLLIIVHKDKIGPGGTNTELALGIADPTLSPDELISRLEKILVKLRAASAARSGESSFTA